MKPVVASVGKATFSVPAAASVATAEKVEVPGRRRPVVEGVGVGAGVDEVLEAGVGALVRGHRRRRSGRVGREREGARVRVRRVVLRGHRLRAAIRCACSPGVGLGVRRGGVVQHGDRSEAADEAGEADALEPGLPVGRRCGNAEGAAVPTRAVEERRPDDVRVGVRLGHSHDRGGGHRRVDPEADKLADVECRCRCRRGLVPRRACCCHDGARELRRGERARRNVPQLEEGRHSPGRGDRRAVGSAVEADQAVADPHRDSGCGDVCARRVCLSGSRHDRSRVVDAVDRDDAARCPRCQRGHAACRVVECEREVGSGDVAGDRGLPEELLGQRRAVDAAVDRRPPGRGADDGVVARRDLSDHLVVDCQCARLRNHECRGGRVRSAGDIGEPERRRIDHVGQRQLCVVDVECEEPVAVLALEVPARSLRTDVPSAAVENCGRENAEAGDDVAGRDQDAAVRPQVWLEGSGVQLPAPPLQPRSLLDGEELLDDVAVEDDRLGAERGGARGARLELVPGVAVLIVGAQSERVHAGLELVAGAGEAHAVAVVGQALRRARDVGAEGARQEGGRGRCRRVAREQACRGARQGGDEGEEDETQCSHGHRPGVCRAIRRPQISVGRQVSVFRFFNRARREGSARK